MLDKIFYITCIVAMMFSIAGLLYILILHVLVLIGLVFEGFGRRIKQWDL